jgi:MFS family permease
LGARFITTIGLQMQSVAVGWQVYSLTHDPMQLGWVGLAQFLPLFVLALVTGHVADRFERRRVMVGCYVTFCLAASALAILAMSARPSLTILYALLVVLGSARAFLGPAGSALLSELVPSLDFPNAVAWSATSWQVATVGGPALGGVVYGAFGPSWVYAMTATLAAGSALLVSTIARRPRPASKGAPTWEALIAGLRFIREKKTILGAISLDLFAVLLGGAVALLPAIARDVLHVGPWGLGILRGAPAGGAAITALALAYRPLRNRAGRIMLASVFVFGAATVVLGVSKSFALTLVMLAMLGAADMVSVFVRQNLVQLGTPDAMRGRVNAVNLVFIGASNELGEFESGLTAAWLGVMPAIVVGGIGTMLVVVAYSLFFPALRDVDEIERASD